MNNSPPANLAQSIQKDSEGIMIAPLEAKYEQWFSTLCELKENDIIQNKNCKLCNSSFRAESELYWENTKGKSRLGNFSMVLRFINNKIKEDNSDEKSFSFENVRNHLMNHYEQQMKNARVRQYGEKMTEMLNYKITKDKMFEALSTSLQMKYMEIASDNTMDPNRQAEAMCKLAKMLTDISETQKTLREEVNTSMVIAEKFVKVWVQMVGSERDPHRQKQLLGYLEMFRDEIPEVVTDA